MDSNPYEAPAVEAEPDPAKLAEACRSLLERRHVRSQVLWLLWRALKKTALPKMLVIVLLVSGAWYASQNFEFIWPMACLLSFAAGTYIRDVRWYFALARQWHTTSQLLDWDRIESIAAGSIDPDARSPH